MGDLELFLNDESVTLPILIKAALAHVQFETIPLIYELIFQNPQTPLLRPSAIRAGNRKLGGVDYVFFGRRY